MTITVYTKPGCFGCGKTIDKLKDAGLNPQTVDITTNSEALNYISDELGYAQAPVVVYEKDGSEDHLSGLQPDKINKVIELEKTH